MSDENVENENGRNIQRFEGDEAKRVAELLQEFTENQYLTVTRGAGKTKSQTSHLFESLALAQRETDEALKLIVERATLKATVKPAPKVEIAPGFALHRWLGTFCPRRFRENVLDELLATGTMMYQEALAEGDVAAARRIRWAMRFWMLKAVFGGFVTGAFSLLGQFRQKSE